jgi:hypothetical protein
MKRKTRHLHPNLPKKQVQISTKQQEIFVFNLLKLPVETIIEILGCMELVEFQRMIQTCQTINKVLKEKRNFILTSIIIKTYFHKNNKNNNNNIKGLVCNMERLICNTNLYQKLIKELLTSQNSSKGNYSNDPIPQEEDNNNNNNKTIEKRNWVIDMIEEQRFNDYLESELLDLFYPNEDSLQKVIFEKNGLAMFQSEQFFNNKIKQQHQEDPEILQKIYTRMARIGKCTNPNHFKIICPYCKEASYKQKKEFNNYHNQRQERCQTCKNLDHSPRSREILSSSLF